MRRETVMRMMFGREGGGDVIAREGGHLVGKDGLLDGLKEIQKGILEDGRHS